MNLIKIVSYFKPFNLNLKINNNTFKLKKKKKIRKIQMIIIKLSKMMKIFLKQKPVINYN